MTLLLPKQRSLLLILPIPDPTGFCSDMPFGNQYEAGIPDLDGFSENNGGWLSKIPACGRCTSTMF